MNLTMTYRHLDSTPSIENKIKEKAAHLKKYFQGKIDINWTSSIEGHRHCSEINVHAGKSFFHSKAEDDCLYKTMDEALTKIERQIRRKDRKIKDKIHRPHFPKGLAE